MNEQELQNTEEFLDKIDIASFANENDKSIYDLMDRIESAYQNAPELDNDIFEGFVFNWMDHNEFLEYLEKRYGKKFEAREITTTVYKFK